jgi:3-hydroxyisobutyrate dehydrogenase-like beta-hydroxyacid dehydrogenase
MTIGFIGLGRMGGAMAARLALAGNDVIVYDLDPAAAEALVSLGATRAASVTALAERAQIVFLSLPSLETVAETVLGSGGLVFGQAVRTIVDLSTSGPGLAVTLAAGLRARGIDLIDAPVSGGIAGARAGTLSLMVSGPERAFEAVRPLLETLGRIFFMGTQSGAGQTMKLVNNLLNACAIAITAEGMTIGAKAGLDPRRMIEVLNASTGRNSATQDKWPRAVLPRTFDFGFATGLCLKDVRLCQREAQALGVSPEVGSVVLDLLERAAARYGPDSDFTVVTKIVEAAAGLDPERPSQPSN